MRKKGYSGIIIGVTGHCREEDIKDFERRGADAVLPKPFKFEDIATLLVKLIEGERIRVSE